MTRRYPDFSRPRPKPLGTIDWMLVVIAIVLSVMVLVVFLGLALSVKAHAHDIWINHGSYRNPAGEWCCGAEDCGIVDKSAVHTTAGGYSVKGGVTYGQSITGNEADGPTRREGVNDLIPYSQSLPSPDGAYWRCKRPDGTPRCFFAPPPGS